MANLRRARGRQLLALLLAGAVTVLVAGCDDGGGEQSSATATVQPEAAAGDVVQRFVEALGTRDADALYAIQEEAYKRVCGREAFQSVADRLQTLPLEGPAQIVVNGDEAGAALYEVQPDGSRVRVVVSLVREANGEWRLSAPSTTGCAP